MNRGKNEMSEQAEDRMKLLDDAADHIRRCHETMNDQQALLHQARLGVDQIILDIERSLSGTGEQSSNPSRAQLLKSLEALEGLQKNLPKFKPPQACGEP